MRSTYLTGLLRGLRANLQPHSRHGGNTLEESLSAFPPNQFLCNCKGKGKPLDRPGPQPGPCTFLPQSWGRGGEVEARLVFNKSQCLPGVLFTGFRHPLDCQERRPLVVLGFLQRSLPSSSQNWGAQLPGLTEHAGSLSQKHLGIASCPSSSSLPIAPAQHTHTCPVLVWISPSLGRGLNRLGAPPSVSSGST